MKIFLTGATGYIGNQLLQKLLAGGHEVVALCRNNAGTTEADGITWVKGTLEDGDSIIKAMSGCSHVYHCGAVTGQWHADPKIFYRVNVTGTENILEAARRHGIEGLVMTSTVGIYGKSLSLPLTEDDPRLEPFNETYDLTKYIAEQRVKAYAAEGRHAVIVNPCRVYGPGKSTQANAITKIIGDFLKKSYYLVPGDGSVRHNYVFVEDVVDGHILAMEHGRPGENYILGGENISMNEFYRQLELLTGFKRKRIEVPAKLMNWFAHANMAWTRLSGMQPIITPSFYNRIFSNRLLTCKKAITELNYNPISVAEGLRLTLEKLGVKDLRLIPGEKSIMVA